MSLNKQVDLPEMSPEPTSVIVVSPFALRLRLMMTVVLAVLTLFLTNNLRDLSLATNANIITVVIIIVFILMVRTTSRGLGAVAAIYLLIFGLFHFGATAVYGLGLPFSLEYEIVMVKWFYSSITVVALLLAFLGFLFCVIGVYIAYYFISKSRRKGSRESDLDKILNSYVSRVGFLLLALGTIGWFVHTVNSGGVGLLLGAYREYLDIAGTSVVSFLYFMISLGLPLLASTPSGRWHKVGYALFAIWSVVVLPLGLRGEVLFPLGVAAAMAARGGFRLTLRRALPIMLIILILIPAVRQLRQVGLRNYSAVEFQIGVADAFTEMGGSLRPVSEVVRWQAVGEDYIYGASYWAPVERLFLRVFPIKERISAQEDERLMNILVMRRVGAIGFSPIAEAFRNFGVFGVAFIMLVMGLLLGWLDLWPVKPLYNGILVAVFVPLLIQIRNSFTPVIAQVIIGIGLILVLWFVASQQEIKRAKIIEDSQKAIPLRTL